MKEIGKDKVCYYCLGCNKLEEENNNGTKNCKYFAPVIVNWHELLMKEVFEKE